MDKGRDNLKGMIRRTLDLYAYSKSPSDTCGIFPDHVHIEPTNACNLRCVHCHQSSIGTFFTKDRGLMDFGLYTRLIDQLATLSERITLDSHGEPTNHPRIVDMVEYARRKGLSVSLLTNASVLTEEKADALIAAGLNRIVFSFEGSTPQLHEIVRRRSNYYKTMRNILYFLKKNNEEGHPVFVAMSMVKSSYTESDVPLYKKFFQALPVDTIFVNPMLNLSGGSPLGDERARDKIDAQPVHNVCRMPWMNLAIGWDGKVSPCIIDYNESHIVGDTNTESLQDIWNNSLYRKFRQCHLDGDFSWIEAQGPLCADCNLPYDPEYREYDLLDMGDYATNYILRQAEVHAAPEEKSPVPPTETPEHAHCVAELARFDQLLADGMGKRAPEGARNLRPETLRETAQAGRSAVIGGVVP